jgi:polyisoprenoid-binding protein YceI
MRVFFCTILCLGFLLIAPNLVQGQIFQTKTGRIHFFSETPIENIEAVSNKAEGALLPSTGQVSARIPVSSFEFPKALMQRHFNENYLESDKYPLSTLEGKLADPKPLAKTKNGTVSQNLNATLTMHGVGKDYVIPCQIEMKNGEPIRAKGKFPVKLADHNIEIPKIVIKQIAEVIDVDFDFALEPKK